MGEALADELAQLGFEDGDDGESEEVINTSIKSLEQQTGVKSVTASKQEIDEDEFDK